MIALDRLAGHEEADSRPGDGHDRGARAPVDVAVDLDRRFAVELDPFDRPNLGIRTPQMASEE